MSSFICNLLSCNLAVVIQPARDLGRGMQPWYLRDTVGGKGTDDRSSSKVPCRLAVTSDRHAGMKAILLAISVGRNIEI
jgi:hypothetical protein